MFRQYQPSNPRQKVKPDSRTADQFALCPWQDPGSRQVLIDIGTGFYVEKTRVQALSHYQAKVDFVRKNLEALQDTIQKKQDNLSYLINIMQSKMQSQKDPS